jgi:diguanylate cyclase (GGDEF)-like protein
MNESTRETDTVESLKKRIFQMENLLHANQMLCNIIDPMELYSIIAELIREQLKVSTLCVFDYHPDIEKFELVYSHGLNDLGLTFNKNDGPLWQKILQKELFPVTDTSGNPIFNEFSENYILKELRSQWWIPFIMKEEVVGLLTIGEKDNACPIDEIEFNYIKHIANQASMCINACKINLKRQKERQELDRILQNLSLLYNIGRAMTYIRDLKKLLQYILRKAIMITNAEKGSIMLLDPDTNQLCVSFIEGLEDNDQQEKINNKQVTCKSFKPGEGLAGQVFQEAKPIVLNNINIEDKFIEAESSFVRSIACIPMLVNKDAIGVINVTNKRNDEHFTEVDVEMLKAVTDQAAVAINKAQLREMAVTDFLTGLYIRRYFMSKLQDELLRSERYNKVFSIVMADIDKFKNVNDTYGHIAGDNVLKAVGDFFQTNVRQVDIIARYGGEEFVILFPETDKEAAYVLAERLRKGFSQIRLDNLPGLSISSGISTFPEDGKDIQTLIKNADTALYSAKQRGRNNVVKFSKKISLKTLKISVA